MSDEKRRARAVMIDPNPFDVAWYRQNGNHPQRIARDSNGAEYVIGDAAWNAGRDWRSREHVELLMDRAFHEWKVRNGK